MGLYKSFGRRLDLRAPEDRFATADQIEERFGRHVDVPGVESAIVRFLRGWADNDRSELGSAADDLVKITRKHFGSQGVPVFSRSCRCSLSQRVADVLSGLLLRNASANLALSQMLSARLADRRETGTRPGAAIWQVNDNACGLHQRRRSDGARRPGCGRDVLGTGNSDDASGAECTAASRRGRTGAERGTHDGARERQRQEAYDNAWDVRLSVVSEKT
jgi:hypothetical protein